MEALETADAVCPRCGFDNAAGPKAQPAHALPCGTILAGRYVAGRMLGQGGFGITYIGYNLALEMPVCIKEYYPEGAVMRSSTQSRAVYWGTSERARELQSKRESFVKEAQKTVKLRDLNHVVKVWDVFFENETAYIIMDYLEGETLKSRLLSAGQPYDERTCVELLSPVILDLEKVHERGIIHRDISPDNLLLQRDGSLILLGMGAAKDLSGGGQSSYVVAKQGFSPPEQYRVKGSVGPWTDVYAMCATIYYCLTGKLLPAPMDRMSGEPIDWDGISPAMRKVLEKGLALNFEERIQRMGQLHDALTGAVRGLNAPLSAHAAKPAPTPASTPASSPSPGPASVTAPASTPKKRLPLILAAMLVLAIGIFYMGKRSGSREIAVTAPPVEDTVQTLAQAEPSPPVDDGPVA